MDKTLCPRCHGDLAALGLVDLGQGTLCLVCWDDEARRPRQATPLELATAEELIEELCRRDTFRGLVAWQAESYKGSEKPEWKWRARNCDQVAITGELAEKLKTGE